MSWQYIRWRMAAIIRDMLESRSGVWRLTLLAGVMFAAAVLSQRGDKANMVAFYVVDMTCFGIAFLGTAVWRQDGGGSREAREHRTYVKLLALGSIAVSAGLIIHRIYN